MAAVEQRLPFCACFRKGVTSGDSLCIRKILGTLHASIHSTYLLPPVMCGDSFLADPLFVPGQSVSHAVARASLLQCKSGRVTPAGTPSPRGHFTLRESQSLPGSFRSLCHLSAPCLHTGSTGHLPGRVTVGVICTNRRNLMESGR